MKVLTFSEESFREECIKLLDLVLSEFEPDVVVSIASGGDYIADYFKNKLDVEYISVSKKRHSTKKKSSLIGKLVFKLLKVLPYFILNILRIIEHYYLIKFENNTHHGDNFSLDIDQLEITNKNILIVDDAVDTGSTMKIVKNAFSKRYPSSGAIKTAVIVQTSLNSVIKPDFVLYEDCLIRFPWSNDKK